MYAVEFSHRSGRDLMNVAKKRTNIIPIIEDARHPHKYRMLVGVLCVVWCGCVCVCLLYKTVLSCGCAVRTGDIV